MRILIINILVLSNIFMMYSQNSCDTLPFINCNENIILTNNNYNVQPFIQKLRSSNPISIVHIGDSHLQAGFFTEKIKQELFQKFNKDTFASPGFIFPYTIAKTNNPFFYQVNYSGNWEYCKNVDKEKTCSLGLSGITVRTKDSTAAIQIKMRNGKYNNPVNYYFDHIKILHSAKDIDIRVNETRALSHEGISTVQLENVTDSISINIINPTNSSYELYGIMLESKKSLINYHTIGVNGATAQSYLKCDYFSKHLNEINPDLIIISLGTNEAFDKEYNLLEHEFVLKDLLYQIKDATPGASVLLTTPNGHFKDGVPNRNVQTVRETILKACHEFGLAHWDFYTIMGGEGSMENWHKKGITGEDKIHFKKKGYEVQGELFVKALSKLIENY